MSTHILVADDEKELADVLELYLVSDGHTVHKCYTGAEALGCMEHTNLDLAILGSPTGTASSSARSSGRVLLPHHHAHGQDGGWGQDHGPDHRGRVANRMVALFRNALGMDYDAALRLYERTFRSHMGAIILLSLLLVFAGLFYVYLQNIVRKSA